MILPKDNKKLIVTQSNKLAEARYKLTIGEQRLILLMISLIQPNDEDFKDYEIKVLDFVNLLEISNKDHYQRMRMITKSLVGRVLEIEERDRLLQISWLSSAEYNPKTGTVKLSFDPKLKPYLLGLKKSFSSFGLSVAIHFRSFYTIRIYILLNSNKYKDYFDVYYQELRCKLGVKENEYKEYKRFRQFVIDQAKKELSEKAKNGTYKSDLSFNIEVIERKNRKIHKLRFHIIKQQYQESLPIETESKKIESKVDGVQQIEYKDNPAYIKLIDLGVWDNESQELVKNLDTGFILEQLKYIEHDYKAGVLRVDNLSSFINKVLMKPNGYISKHKEDTKKKEQKNQAEIEAKKQAKIEAKETAKRNKERLEKLSFKLEAVSLEEIKELSINFINDSKDMFLKKKIKIISNISNLDEFIDLISKRGAISSLKRHLFEMYLDI